MGTGNVSAMGMDDEIALAVWVDDELAEIRFTPAREENWWLG